MPPKNCISHQHHFVHSEGIDWGTPTSEPRPVNKRTGIAPADEASLEFSRRSFVAAGNAWFDSLSQIDALMTVCAGRRRSKGPASGFKEQWRQETYLEAVIGFLTYGLKFRSFAPW